MPCYIRATRRLGIQIPKDVSFFEDQKKIEEKMEEKLKVKNHQEMHDKIDTMDKEELRKIIEECLKEVQKEKEDSNPPDRLKELNKKAKEIWKAV